MASRLPLCLTADATRIRRSTTSPAPQYSGSFKMYPNLWGFSCGRLSSAQSGEDSQGFPAQDSQPFRHHRRRCFRHNSHITILARSFPAAAPFPSNPRDGDDRQQEEQHRRIPRGDPRPTPTDRTPLHGLRPWRWRRRRFHRSTHFRCN